MVGSQEFLLVFKGAATVDKRLFLLLLKSRIVAREYFVDIGEEGEELSQPVCDVID